MLLDLNGYAVKKKGFKWLSIFAYLGPFAQYKDLVAQGKLQHDPYQEKVALELDNLLGRLEQYENDMEEYHVRLNDSLVLFLQPR